MLNIINYLNGWIWSVGMLILIVGTGLIFSIRLGFFQFVRHGEMWRRIFQNDNPKAGISTFTSFCTTMAARIGTGNVAGVAVAIYAGGPGALFWMWIVGCTNAAVAFVECTLGQLYKVKVDGEYRCSGAQCAERGLGWKKYGTVMAIIMILGTAFFMPAAATYTICDSFYNACRIPTFCTAIALALIFGGIVSGGIKRIGKFSSYAVPFMMIIYVVLFIVILIMNIQQIPNVFLLIIKSAFNKGAVMGGIEGGLLAAILQGVKRGTFSSAAGMGESTPAAAAAETSHPIKQGMANAAGVFLDTIVVCTITGLMILLTGCYNTADAIGGYTSVVSGLEGKEGGVIFVQQATKSVLGEYAPLLIAVILLFFAFTCIVYYYYEAETAICYLLRNHARARKIVKKITEIVMTGLIIFWGITSSELAWSAADLALGINTWINMIVLWCLFPKVMMLYSDYKTQMRNGRDPVYNPEQENLCWKGVDKIMWQEICNRYNEQTINNLGDKDVV